MPNKDGSTVNITVNAPKLKGLQISLDDVRMEVEDVEKLCIVADVSNLEKLDLKRTLWMPFLKKLKAPLAGRVLPVLMLIKKHRILADIFDVKYLFLSASFLGDARIEYQCTLPTLLSVCHAWKSLTNALKVSPKLKYLEYRCSFSYI